MSWKDLDIKLKAELIKLGVLSGIRDKSKIIQMYDLSIELPTLVRKFEEGGLANPALEKEKQMVGLDRLIQDYLVQDPTVMFGVKTLEDSYKASEAIRKYLLAKLAVEIEKEDIIKNDVEKFINKNTFAPPNPAVIPIMKSGALASQNSNEVLELLETTLLLLQEDTKSENNNNEENKLNTDVNTEESLLYNYPKKNSWELVAEIARSNIEEYLKSVQELLKRLKDLKEQQSKLLELVRLDSIQKNVLDSLTKELKPNTVQAQTSDIIEVPKETIQEVHDIIIPKLEKGTPEYYADSTAKRINRVLDEHFLQNPTLYSLLTGNFNFDKIQESFIHKDVNKESHRQPTDNSYIKGRQPLEHQHRAIIIHSSAGTHSGDLKSLAGKERAKDPNTGELLYNEDRTPKFRLAGAHFYISKDGEIYLLVGEDDVAFHSSVGQMFDAVDPNSFAFGIELEGYSYEEGKSNEHKNTDFSKNPKLLESLGKVVAYLCNKYNIPYELIQTHYDVEDYYELNFYKNLGFLKGIEGRKDLHGIEWKPPRGKVDIMPKQYAPIKNYLETHVFKKVNSEHAFGGYLNNQYPEYFKQFNKGGFISNNPTLALVGKVKKYDEGGLKDSNIILDYIFNGPLKRKKENSLEYRQALFNNVDPRNGYPSPWTAVKYYNTVVDALNSGDNSKKWETDGSIGQETAAAGWAKFLDLPYNKELFPVWNGDTVSLSPELEREIPIDTNLLKLDIQRIIYDRNLDRSMGIFDREEAYKTLLLTKQLALNNLRKTYKTGEWVQMNEFMGNSVNPFDWNEDYVSPLNVLLFYGLKYDKNTNSMLYGDLYNLNAFDYFLPGNPFIIRGSIPLDKKKNGGFIFPTKTLTNKVNKFREGGYEDGDENTIYTAGYSEPITVTAKKEISKKQQMEADEEWREYLKQHPIQIGSEEYNRLPERAKAQVHKNNWISKRTIKENPLLQYFTNYFKNKTGLYTPFYIDLSDKKVLYIDKNTNNVESILGNEFYELKNPNTVRYKKDFINTQDTLLGDRNIPLSKINTFYGIEDGKLKVGNIDIFKDNTIIVPNRSKNYGKLSKIIVKEPYKIPRLTHKERKKAMEKSRRYVEFVKNNILQKYGIELSTRDIKDPLSIKDKEIQLHVINIRNDFYTGYTENPRDRYSSLYGVTVNNDTIPIKINATPKVFFGNEQGNSIFVSNLSDQDVLYKVNEFLKHNPSIPIMIDNGRFSHFTLNPTEISQYSGVTPPEKLMMIGTVYKNGGFLFPNLVFSHKFEK